jgi:hypothetical protein
VFHFTSQHPIIVAVGLLIALAIILKFARFRIKRSRQRPSADLDFDSVVRLTTSHKTAEPLTFWRDEIRNIAERYGSPVKAAIRIEHSISTLDFKSLEVGQLEALHEYWMEISDWCGKTRIELHSLDPERRWSPTAWTRLFNVFGRVNLLVQIAWSERSHPHSHRKANEA